MSKSTRSQLPIFGLSPFRSALLAVLALGLMSFAARSSEPKPAAAPAALVVVNRSISQEQGGWLIDYRLRYRGRTGMVVTPTEVMVKVEGWVSNSRVAAHATPRWSSLVVSGSSGLTGVSEVVTADDESERCRERAIVQVWSDDPAGQTPAPPLPAPVTSGTAGLVGRSNPAAEPLQPLLSVAPDSIVRVRIKLDHAHFLYGDYDPLLGTRDLKCQLGSASFSDALPLDRERYVAQPLYNWPAPPEDRRDTGVFFSAPDSLHLEAHVPGNQYYRFPERPVRYATKMRLRYYYFIAAGTEGECHARVAQYKDTPTAWKVLTRGGHEECLNTVGRWVKVERVFRTEPDATTLALDFRISGADVGEMWIDDVTLEPIGCPIVAGP